MGPTGLVMVRGDTRIFSVTITEAGAPVNCSGSTLTFNASTALPSALRFSRSTTDGSVIFTDPVNGLAQLTIAPSVTLAFPNQILTFRWQWVLVDTFGNVSTTEWGHLEIFANA